MNKVTSEQLKDFLFIVDQDFPVPISKKVDLEEYAQKLSTKANCITKMHDDKIVGLVAGYIDHADDDFSYIALVAVRKEYRGQKLGVKLLEEYREICQNKHIKAIHLYTDRGNASAIAMYKSAGYQEYVIENEPRTEDMHLIYYIEEREKRMTAKKEESINLLITSVGRRTYLVQYFKEALQGIGKVYVSNSSILSPALQCADGYVISPLIYDDHYIDFILDYCKEKNISAIISLFDVDLPVLAKHKKVFAENGVKVLVSDEKVIDICNDKYKTAQFLAKNGFLTPKTYVNYHAFIEDYQNGDIKFPVVIKPRWGMGSLGVNVAENMEELSVLYRKTQHSIENTYLKYEASLDIEHSILIQEKIAGQEYGLDIINDLEGNYCTTIVKKKHAMRAGETDCAITVNDPVLKELGRKLSEALKHIGNLDVDVFMNHTEVYVLEMNARFGGGYPFSHAAGVNLPKAIVHWLKGESQDCLKEQFDVMYQKDIVLVPIDSTEIKEKK